MIKQVSTKWADFPYFQWRQNFKFTNIKDDIKKQLIFGKFVSIMCSKWNEIIYNIQTIVFIQR